MLGAFERLATYATDAAGRFSASVPAGRLRIRVRAIGYRSADTSLVVGRTAAGAGDPARGAMAGAEPDSVADPDTVALVIALDPQPVELRALTVEADRRAGEARSLFRREVSVGVVGLSNRELQGVPALISPDPLRTLQSLPGVTARNVLSAELHVRGGAPDQNLFLLDGARVFAPYHLFGMFGTFNADAIEGADFYRGAIPARYGDALSSVVRMEQRLGGSDDEPVSVAGGLGLLSGRLAARGRLPFASTEWLVAGRRTHGDAVAPWFGGQFPFGFWDAQAGFSFEPARGQTVRASFFASSDRYRPFLRGGGEDLASRWRNRVGSIRWTNGGEGPWTFSANGWASGFAGSLAIGGGASAPTTTSEVRAGAAKFEASRRGERGGLRAGVELAAGRAKLQGTGPSAFAWGRIESDYLRPTLYAELERWLGGVRLAPGIRVGYGARAGEWWIEPRVGARMHLTEDIALTVGASRTRQRLSTLRDGRTIVPGVPLWFVHPRHAPASASTGGSAELRGWWGAGWSWSVGAYARRLDDVPRFQPVGTREVTNLRYDDGHALGLELFLRRHVGRVTGWLSYTLARVRMERSGPGRDAGDPYDAPWDRRHAAELALVWHPETPGWDAASARGWSFSLRGVVGTGTPFWPFVGYIRMARLSPVGGRKVERGDLIPVWGKDQLRFPPTVRLDVAARYRFRIGGVSVEPFISVVNATRRKNVLFYRIEDDPDRRSGCSLDPDCYATKDTTPTLVPETALPFSVLPSLGASIRF